MNRSTEGSLRPRRRLDFGAPSSPFEVLSPISRFDETDLKDLSPFVHNQHHLNGTFPRLVPETPTSPNLIAKQRRRCSEIVVASSRNASTDAAESGFPSFSTSHWLSALFEWIYVTFSERKHQEYVLKEIVHCLNELGIIPFNFSITSEQLLQIQQVIDSLRLRIWQEHNRSNELSYTNGMRQRSLLPFGAGGARQSSQQLKHSLTFGGSSLARFAFAAQRPAPFALSRLPVSALFPAGRYKNDFVEQDHLGRGGFGVVVKAVNRFDGTAYAIKKVFVKHQMVNHDQLLRALREVRAASSLNHPNVVRYYAAWIESVIDSEDEAADDGSDDGSDDDADGYKHSSNTSNSNLRKVPSTTSLSDEFDLNHRLNMELDRKKKPFYKKSKQPASKKDTADDDGDIYFYDDSEPSNNKNKNKMSNGIQQNLFHLSDDDDDDDDVIFGNNSNKSVEKHESRLVPVRQRSKSERRSPSLNSEIKRPPSQPTKVCLFIQMELCTLGTLADLLTRRNSRAASLSSSPPTTPFSLPSPGSPINSIRHGFLSGFDPGSPSMSQSPPVESVVNASWDASVFLQIVRGLAYVHSRGVIHRDLKPANIFLTGSSLTCPEVKLGDFGLTRFDVFSESGDSTSLAQGDLMRYSEHRRYSNEVGTRTYASPEQVTRLVYTRQSDMFSLGLILYELYRPFATTMERLANFELIRKGGPDDLDVSERYPETWRLVKRLTAQNASRRPNCTDLLAELETNEVDRLREVVEQQRREIERLRQAIVVDSPSLSARFSPYSSS